MSASLSAAGFWVCKLEGGGLSGGDFELWVVSGSGYSFLVGCWVGSCKNWKSFSWMVSPLRLPLPYTSLVLQGQWIERDHCTITSTCGVVILRPTQGARCTVNGREVTASCRLTQGRTIYLPVYIWMNDGHLQPYNPTELNKTSFNHVLLNLCTETRRLPNTIFLLRPKSGEWPVEICACLSEPQFLHLR